MRMQREGGRGLMTTIRLKRIDEDLGFQINIQTMGEEK
jgi:hypothetical protein